MLRLKSNYPHILMRAWSVRLWVLAFLCIILDEARPFLIDYVPFMPEWLLGVSSGVLAAGGLVARVLVQRNLAG